MSERFSKEDRVWLHAECIATDEDRRMTREEMADLSVEALFKLVRGEEVVVIIEPSSDETRHEELYGKLPMEAPLNRDDYDYE